MFYVMCYNSSYPQTKVRSNDVTMRNVLDEKQYVGNPHTRYDEGKVASVTTPKRKIPLNIAMVRKSVIVMAAVLAVTGIAFADGAETLRDFGSADTSAQNDFWATGGYTGVRVFRASTGTCLMKCASRLAYTSVAGPVDTRFRTSAVSSYGTIKTTPAGVLISFR